MCYFDLSHLLNMSATMKAENVHCRNFRNPNPTVHQPGDMQIPSTISTLFWPCFETSLFFQCCRIHYIMAGKKHWWNGKFSTTEVDDEIDLYLVSPEKKNGVTLLYFLQIPVRFYLFGSIILETRDSSSVKPIAVAETNRLARVLMYCQFLSQANAGVRNAPCTCGVPGFVN